MNHNGSGQTNSGISGGIFRNRKSEIMPGSRATLRQHYKSARLNLSEDERNAANVQINGILENLSWLAATQTVAAFLANKGEVDLHPWCKSFWRQGGAVVLPRVGKQGEMTFLPYTADTPLVPNRYGIFEPHQGQPVQSQQIDVVLVPLLAYDNQGNRLGMGGGYYDRYLSQLDQNVPIIGVAFSCQHASIPLPQESWDIPLHAVVTELGVLEFR